MLFWSFYNKQIHEVLSSIPLQVSKNYQSTKSRLSQQQFYRPYLHQHTNTGQNMIFRIEHFQD